MGRLAIIAGKGPQPADIISAATDAGEHPLIIRIKAHCEDTFDNHETADFSLGQIGAVIDFIKKKGCSRIVMAGKVNRPPLNPLAMDADSMRLLGQVLLKGDDAALEIIAAYFTNRGFEFVPQSQFLKDRFLPYGFRCGRNLDKAELESAHTAIRLLRSIGDLDVGQAAIIQGERILAIEAAEGTDVMIERAGHFVQNMQPSALFVKMAKSAQNLEQDPPGFGTQTIRALISNGISLAVIEPETVFLVESRNVIEKTAISEGLAILSSDLIPS